MVVVKPISDLRNRFRAISHLVHRKKEPVLLTKSGKGDMVVMSLEKFREMKTRLDLYEKLAVAEAEESAGSPTFSLNQVLTELKKQHRD